MERLTEKDDFNNYYVKQKPIDLPNYENEDINWYTDGFMGSYLLGKCVDKLAEYENIGTVKEFRDEKLARALLIPRLLKEKKELKHELEVCKRALKSACKWIDSSAWLITDGTAEDWERAKQTTNDFYLDQARKELKGGSDDKN